MRLRNERHTTTNNTGSLASELLEILAGPEWHERALCRQSGAGPFFTEGEAAALAARPTCEGCPVRAQCALTGVEQEYGIWAGFTTHALKRMRTTGSPTWNKITKGAADAA